MIVYGIIMFVVAAIFAVVSVLIYRGKTELIHDYHQKNVTDKKGYGKEFGMALGAIAVFIANSGVFALLWKSMIAAVFALVFGLIAGIAAIVYVQKKYNGGIF